MDRLTGRTKESLSHMTPKENLLRAIRHDHPEWVPNGMESVITIRLPVVERPAQAGKDAFGVSWALEEGARGGTFPLAGGHVLSGLSQWRDQLVIPDVAAADWHAVRVQAAAVDRRISLVSGFFEMGLFERACLLLGMEEALMAFVSSPDDMEQLLSVLADYKIALIRRFDEEVKPDLIWYGDDWGTQGGLFLAPAIWRRIIKPHTRRIYECMRQRRILINQHSCGKIEDIVPDLVEMGVDIWNPCQPCNDLAGLKRRFRGRITFCGGIDSQFVLDRAGVAPGDVRAEVRRRITDLAEGGGYIAAPSHDVPHDRRLLDAMHEEIALSGRRIYQRA